MASKFTIARRITSFLASTDMAVTLTTATQKPPPESAEMRLVMGQRDANSVNEKCRASCGEVATDPTLHRVYATPFEEAALEFAGVSERVRLT
jgi:hypothetical protein